jgi:hypothetical protein
MAVVSKSVDHFLTLLFAIEFGALVWHCYNTGEASFYLFACVAFSFSIELVRWLFGAFARKFSNTSLHHIGDPMSDEAVLKKAKDQAWQLALHVSMSLYEVYLMYPDFLWWNSTEHCWIPWPGLQNDGDQLRYFYLIQLVRISLRALMRLCGRLVLKAIWTATLFYHRFLDSRKKDYVMMFIHHLVTIMLIFASHSVGFHRIGVIVLFVHDVSDIFIDLVKPFASLLLCAVRCALCAVRCALCAVR